MVERVCADCRQANPLEDRYCGFCGAPLRAEPAALQPAALLPVLQRMRPEQLQQVGAALALGAAALAAEVGLAWLRRRSNSTAPGIPAASETTIGAVNRSAQIVSQRVIETWERGELVRRIVDRQIWRRDES
jgi:hypothetical protein